MKKPEFLKVPVQLIQYSIQKQYLNELRVFLIMKMESIGHFPNEREVITHLNTIIGYKDEKSTRMNLESLLKLGWLNYDIKSNLIFIKGFEAIRQKLDLNLRGGVYLYSEDLSTKKQFRGFAAGAVINNLVNSQKVTLRMLGLKKGCPTEDILNAKSGYYRVANSVLSKVFKCPLSQAYYLKKIAKVYQYITIKKNYIDTGYKCKNIEVFKRGKPELVFRITLIKDKIVLKDCDLIAGNMKFSRRGKI